MNAPPAGAQGSTLYLAGKNNQTGEFLTNTSLGDNL
jgi:hypothetical protein